MRPTILWRIFSLAAYWYIFVVTFPLEGNAFSPLPISQIDSKSRVTKNTTVLRTGSPREFLATHLKNSESDSPERATNAPDSTGKTNSGGLRRANGVAGGDDGSDGAIENNSWKRYPNGTIVHDVRISLVHPANMAGIMKDPGGSADDETNHVTDRQFSANISREGRASSLNYDTTITPLGSLTTDDEFSTTAGNRTGNSSTTDDELAPDNEKANITDSSFAARQMSSDGKFSPVINLGISINAKGSCFSECLTKCSTAESNGLSQATCLPSCLRGSVESTKGRLPPGSDYFPGETNSSTGSVPILTLNQTADLLQNITNSDFKVASGIEIGMLKTKDAPEPKLGFLLEDICLSENCVLKAADILRRLKKSANPCDSFYEFACGGYFKNELPGGESSRSIFSDISSDILARMYTVLKSPLLADDRLSVKLLKRFYGQCVLTSPKDLFMDALKELGGWPSPYSPTRVPRHIWGGIAFNWTYGMFLEYDLVSINLTFADEDKWMLNVDYPGFVKMALNSDSGSVLDEMERDIRIVASALGIDNSTTRRVLEDLRIFMASAIKYAKATVDAGKGVFSLQDLQAKFIHFDLFKKLPSLLRTAIDIEDNETIYVSNVMYLQKVDELLRDSTVRTQEVHLVLTALRTLLVLIGTATDNSREKYCVKLTGKLFPQLFGHLYSSTFVSDSKVASATRIASHVRDSLLNMIQENGEATIKGKVHDGISKSMFVWSHRNAINDDLNGIQKGFEETPTFLGFVKTGIWNLKKVTYTYLHQRANSTLASFIERYSEVGYGVNAYYFSQRVLIPYSALHENFFDPDVPPYVSYGGLGLIVGHELLHSVITSGDILDSADYRSMEKCMIDQFDEFAKKHSYARVNGVVTKDENIADYGGFKVAYRAFMEWYNHASKDSKEKRLPGLHKFNEKQMFWLTAATYWCQKVSPDFKSTSVDKHAPPMYRVDGQFANIPEFARDFNCPNDSPMNPKEKCSLW